jgi:hypothetical protein
MKIDQQGKKIYIYYIISVNTGHYENLSFTK